MNLKEYIECTYPYVAPNDLYNRVMDNPNIYENDTIRTSGRVYQIVKRCEEEFDYLVFGDSKFSKIGAAIFKDEYYTEINKGEYIEILCVVKGTDKRTKVSGESIELPLVYIARVLNK